MGFALRINFVDVIVGESLHNTYMCGKIDGYIFDIRLSNYRGHYLSVIETFVLTVDAQPVAKEAITFEINGKEFYLHQLPFATTEFWNVLEPAHIRVRKAGGLSCGSHHICLEMMCCIPYLPVPGGDGYMPLDAGGEKTLLIKEAIMP